jgi:alpha-galactosidase
MDDTVYEMKKPYALMGEILKNVDRDIVFNMCQYGKKNAVEWGAEVGAHSWRTTTDIISGRRYLGIGLLNAKYYEYAGPGHWNDPDYILIGTVGEAYKPGQPPEKSKLTPSEQYQYMSMWSLMAAPLFFAGDMTRMDDFTMNVLCNSEVIDVNQDSLGKQAKIVDHTDDYFVMVKDLVDGSKAVGLFNNSEFESDLSVSWETLGLKGKHKIRDIWRQKDIGVFDNAYEAKIPRHGVSLVRIYP